MVEASDYIKYNGIEIPFFRYNTAIVGSGAAGLNAADSLYTLGVRDVAIITEDINLGTSRNAGSDKQTYYKLTLGGGEADSVRQMAGTLYAGGCVDGDIALCEAGLSAECFFKLVSLGVPFPRDLYGGWPGYKTDHDPQRRATSAGPYTSKLMTEKLTEAVLLKGIPIHDKLLAIKIIAANDEAIGVLCLDLAEARAGRAAYAAFSCKNIIWATGGPAGIYKNTVYPVGQHGASGPAFEAGAAGANLTEWQYGLASIDPRWNVSGTYMQSLPRFISTGPGGGDEREFLAAYYNTDAELLSDIFLKGYQWPFDARKARGGSSLIDLCVLRETLEGRRVFLDFRSNTGGKKIDFKKLGDEARTYLEQAGACFGAPYDRLLRMNPPAVEYYRSHGVDLAAKPLEIAVCAQHNNGGISVDNWWRTRITGLFSAGEAGATHGTRRPGGSALNAGQAGSLRAAQYIAARRRGDAQGAEEFSRHVKACLSRLPQLPGFPDNSRTPVSNGERRASGQETGDRLSTLLKDLRAEMDKTAGVLRNIQGMRETLRKVKRTSEIIYDLARETDARSLPDYYMLQDLCVSQTMYLSAFINYIETGGKSRGGAIYTDDSGVLPHAQLPGPFAFAPDGGEFDGLIQEVEYNGGDCVFTWRKTRPIPKTDDFFENVWREFRAGEHIGR